MALTFRSARKSVRDRMYIVGDMKVVELETLLRAEFVCSHASVFIFTRELYSVLLKESEQLL